jgi:hypothetical protein
MSKMIGAIVASNLVCGALTATEPVTVTVQHQGSVGSGGVVNGIDLQFEQQIPSEFLEALSDFAKGKTVDLDVALNEPPPGA